MEPGRYEYEVTWQNRAVRYYSPVGFKDAEKGGYELGHHRVWIRYLKDSAHSDQFGTILERLNSMKLDRGERICEYKEMLTVSSIYAMERTRTNFWI